MLGAASLAAQGRFERRPRRTGSLHADKHVHREVESPRDLERFPGRRTRLSPAIREYQVTSEQDLRASDIGDEHVLRVHRRPDVKNLNARRAMAEGTLTRGGNDLRGDILHRRGDEAIDRVWISQALAMILHGRRRNHDGGAALRVCSNAGTVITVMVRDDEVLDRPPRQRPFDQGAAASDDATLTGASTTTTPSSVSTTRDRYPPGVPSTRYTASRSLLTRFVVGECDGVDLVAEGLAVPETLRARQQMGLVIEGENARPVVALDELHGVFATSVALGRAEIPRGGQRGDRPLEEHERRHVDETILSATRERAGRVHAVVRTRI